MSADRRVAVKHLATRSLFFLLTTIVASFGPVACGSTSKRAGSPLGTTSTTATKTALPTGRHIFGDYDADEEESTRSDADGDDGSQPRDGDGDFDNHTGSYYDKDDNSVRYFGHAASLKDRSEIAAIVGQYYAAARAEKGPAACALLAPDFVRLVAEYIDKRPSRPYHFARTCGQVMTSWFKKYSFQLRTYAATFQMTGMRVNHIEGFALLSFKGLPPREIRMVTEHGAWKIGALLDRELP